MGEGKASPPTVTPNRLKTEMMTGKGRTETPKMTVREMGV